MERRHPDLQRVPGEQALRAPGGVRDGDLQEGNAVRTDLRFDVSEALV